MSDFHLAHHGSFALHGAAMCFVEATAVEARDRSSLMDNGIWSDDHIPNIKKVADLVHLLGGRIGLQLAHAGRKSSAPSRYTKDPPEELWLDEVVGPSAVKYNDPHHYNPREMTVEQIQSTIASFGAAAARAAKAGIDMVEIHGAHGYLIHNFLSFVSNLRTDEYGGPSLKNRARLLMEIIQVVRANFPADRPISLRISCTDWIEYKGEPSWDLEQSIELAEMIRDAGVDLLDCSTGGNDPDQKIPLFPGYQVQFAAEIKKRVPGLLVSTVGIINSGQLAEDILQEGKADMVRVGRGFLKHPNLPEHFARELNAKIAYQPTYGAGRHA
ncbi:hypothetical protein EMPS_02156 [Entomortierella parvispora]|uniref:NADH:flavin oxidoreductase/NADH oxidase N-terminal domain-containing protein n=1 Tax=Entomortierella parvispora TaxID=205924 RepID=A0A9P3H4B6_9FUNG|nr:hypothetical protein EMPS_02156 [Entomortierella parvispora]